MGRLATRRRHSTPLVPDASSVPAAARFVDAPFAPCAGAETNYRGPLLLRSKGAPHLATRIWRTHGWCCQWRV